MRGVLLAGGRGTRLGASSLAVNKHLQQVFDKPLIYYPLSTLMLAGVRHVTLVTNPSDIQSFVALLGHGERFGIEISYVPQSHPRGVVDGLLQAEVNATSGPVALILGDNVFHGAELGLGLENIYSTDSATVFGVHVPDPSRYAVAGFAADGSLNSIVEKPELPRSNWIIPGLYVLPPDVWEMARRVTPSPRGELEVADVLNMYLESERVNFLRLSRATFWTDAGTPTSLLSAALHVQTMTNNHGEIVSSPEEIAFRRNWINVSELERALDILEGSDYARQLLRILVPASVAEF